MTYEQLEEGLHKNEHTPRGVENPEPYVIGVPAQGYQQGYQQPLAGWPAYGAPGAYGTGVPVYPGQPTYTLPPPVGGGSDDEKYQITAVGTCTIVPGLKVQNSYAVLVSAVMCFVFAGSICGLAVWMTTIRGGIGAIYFVCSLVEVGLGAFLFRVWRKTLPTHHASITPEHAQAFMDRVLKMEATLPQINTIQSLLNQTNPNTPHEFCVWKAVSAESGRPSSRVVRARFGCQNLAQGQTPQLHLFVLVP